MRYGCVRNSHRLNVGEPVGIRQSRKDLLAKRSVMAKTIRYLDMFSGMGGFREGLTRADRLRAGAKPPRPFCPASDFGGRKRVAPMDGVPRVETAGTHLACRDVRGCGCGDTPPGLLPHDEGRTFAAILHALDRLGYFVEWQVLNSKDFHVPQSRKRVYLVGYLDVRCRGKIYPFTETARTPLIQIQPGKQGERVYSPEGVSCTLTAQAGGMGGKTGLYEVGLPIREDTRKGYKMAYPGDSVNLAYAKNNRRGRVGRQIAHTLTACNDQGTVEACAVLTPDRETIQHSVSPCGRIRRLTPRECLRLQGWADDRIDLVMPIQSDSQLYKQAGNGVTVTVVEAIGKRLAAMGAEWEGGIQ